MRSLVDKLYTGVIHRLCATPKSALNNLLTLTGAVRWFRLKRAAEADSSQRRKQLTPHLYALTALLSITAMTEATAKSYSVDQLKLYSHSRILDWKEFQCFNKIITKESRWLHSARNGSHYGLGQMRSTWYRDLDPYRQIDATLRYITKRYETPCNAWAFHQQRNYF